jgi:hypothetical protein
MARQVPVPRSSGLGFRWRPPSSSAFAAPFVPEPRGRRCPSVAGFAFPIGVDAATVEKRRVKRLSRGQDCADGVAASLN